MKSNKLGMDLQESWILLKEGNEVLETRTIGMEQQESWIFLKEGNEVLKTWTT